MTIFFIQVIIVLATLFVTYISLKKELKLKKHESHQAALQKIWGAVILAVLGIVIQNDNYIQYRKSAEKIEFLGKKNDTLRTELTVKLKALSDSMHKQHVESSKEISAASIKLTTAVDYANTEIRNNITGGNNQPTVMIRLTKIMLIAKLNRLDFWFQIDYYIANNSSYPFSGLKFQSLSEPGIDDPGSDINLFEKPKEVETKKTVKIESRRFGLSKPYYSKENLEFRTAFIISWRNNNIFYELDGSINKNGHIEWKVDKHAPNFGSNFIIGKADKFLDLPKQVYGFNNDQADDDAIKQHEQLVKERHIDSLKKRNE
jgi:hypothetical protein